MEQQEGNQQLRGVWTKLSESGGVAPCKRQGHKAVTYQGGMYLFGGFTDEGLCDSSLFLYSFQRDEWSEVKARKGEAPPPRHSHTAVVYKNSLYIFGGAGDKGSLDSTLYSFNFVQRAWKKMSVKGEAPSGRWGHTAVVYEDSMYLFGGFTDSVTNQLYKFDFAKSRWKEIKGGDAIPAARHLHSAVVYKGCMYIFAGFSNVNYSDLHRFDFKKEEWEQVKEGGGKDRRGHAVVVLGDVMAVHGGRDKTSPLSDILLFNFEKGEWEGEEMVQEKNDENDEDDGGGRPTARYFHSAVVWEGSIWLFGGLGLPSPSDTKSKNLNDFYSFSLEGLHLGGGGGSIRGSIKGGKSSKNRKEEAGDGDRFDILTRVPAEISIAILLHMDPKTLSVMATVSKTWHSLSEDDAVWRALYQNVISARGGTYTETNAVQEKEEGDNPISWKQKMKAVFEDPFTGLNAHKINDFNKFDSSAPEIKLVVLGGGGTGKSAMTIKFIQDHFIEEYDPTIEDSYRKRCMINNKQYVLDILDTAGPEEFSAMRDAYITHSEGFIINYAINTRPSFDELDYHFQHIDRLKKDKSYKVLITGNKCDLEEHRQVSYEEGALFAKSRNVAFLETSAKTGHNIDKAFLGLARMMLKQGLQAVKPARQDKQRCFLQ